MPKLGQTFFIVIKSEIPGTFKDEDEEILNFYTFYLN